MTKDMTNGSPMKLILGFSIPLLFGYLFQQFYNLVDTLIVGRFLGVDALAAVGSTGSLNFLIIGFCMGVCNGFAIPLAHKFGAGDYRGLRAFMVNAICLSAIFAVVMTAVTVVFCRPILELMRTPDNIIDGAYLYIVIIFAGIPATYLYNLISAIIRSMGDSKTPVVFLVISSVMNIALDLVFIINLHLGVAGASLATVISQAASAAASILYMRKLFPEVFPKPRFLYAWKEKSRLLLRLSVPITFQQMVTALGFTVLQRLVNTFGAASIEGYAAMQKIEQIAHIPSNSFHTAIASFTGQNIGAGQTERVQKGYRVTVGFGVGISAALCVLVLIFDERLLAMFSIAGEAMKRGCEHLDLLMLFIWANTITNITCGFLQGAGDVRIPAASGFVNLGIRLALSYLFAAMGLGYICYFISMPPAWCLTSFFVYLRYRSGKWKKYRIV